MSWDCTFRRNEGMLGELEDVAQMIQRHFAQIRRSSDDSLVIEEGGGTVSLILVLPERRSADNDVMLSHLVRLAADEGAPASSREMARQAVESMRARRLTVSTTGVVTSVDACFREIAQPLPLVRRLCSALSAEAFDDAGLIDTRVPPESVKHSGVVDRLWRRGGSR